MTTEDPRTTRLLATMEDLGLSTPPHHHWDGDRLIVHLPELRHYLTVEPDGRQWWTNALPITLPSVLSPTQADRLCALYSKSGEVGGCKGKCPSHSRRIIPASAVEEEEEEPDTVE